MNRKGFSTFGIIALAFVVLVTLGFMGACGTAVSVYNRIQTTGTQVDRAKANIVVQVKRRYDLLPNLASVVQGYATHERTTFTEIADARSKLGGVINAKDVDMKKLAQANSTLGGTIGRLLSISENYPQLQANQGFRDLQSQVEGTENRISVARQDYNEVVQQYNAMIKIFPNNIIAGFMGVTPREFFDVGADSTTIQNAPQLKFNN